ncbi:hypothetical protein M0R04_02740 [Candidatus Dojkabacteria bacterium]|nr:hypothetical protein [Candidatus Dojkabacteria bacterium]
MEKIREKLILLNPLFHSTIITGRRINKKKVIANIGKDIPTGFHANRTVKRIPRIMPSIRAIKAYILDVSFISL